MNSIRPGPGPGRTAPEVAGSRHQMGPRCRQSASATGVLRRQRLGAWVQRQYCRRSPHSSSIRGMQQRYSVSRQGAPPAVRADVQRSAHSPPAHFLGPCHGQQAELRGWTTKVKMRESHHQTHQTHHSTAATPQVTSFTFHGAPKEPQRSPNTSTLARCFHADTDRTA